MKMGTIIYVSSGGQTPPAATKREAMLADRASRSNIVLWGYAQASPQNCLFWGPGFGTSFCSILRPFLTTLLHPCVAEFAASILSLEDAKCEIASLSNTCGLHMFKQWSNIGAICPAGQWNRGTKFRRGDILRIVAKMLASPLPLLSNVDLQGRKQSIQGFLFLRAFSTLPSWDQRGARQKPTEFAKEKRERKAPQPKARTESEEEAGRERYGQGTLPSWTKTTDS